MTDRCRGRGMLVLTDDFTLGDDDDTGSVLFFVGDSLGFFPGEGLLPPALKVRVGDPTVLLLMMTRKGIRVGGRAKLSAELLSSACAHIMIVPQPTEGND